MKLIRPSNIILYFFCHFIEDAYLKIYLLSNIAKLTINSASLGTPFALIMYSVINKSNCTFGPINCLVSLIILDPTISLEISPPYSCRGPMYIQPYQILHEILKSFIFSVQRIIQFPSRKESPSLICISS